MNKELISIIIPVFNVSNYLKVCLDSVLAQTYENYECLLIDDGSTDDSEEICQNYSMLDKRFKTIKINNSGPATARNIGIDNSKGKFITFIDSDDWVHHQYLEYLYSMIISNNADIASTSHQKTHEFIADQPIKNCKERVIRGIEALATYDQDSYYLQSTVWGKLYKRELFDHIRFEDGRLHEDISITYKLIYYSNIIVTSNIVLYYYRKRPESITGNKNIKKLMDYYDAVINKAEFYWSIGLFEQSQKMVKGIIKKVFWRFSKFENSDIIQYSDQINKILFNVRALADKIELKSIMLIIYKSAFLNPILCIKVLHLVPKRNT